MLLDGYRDTEEPSTGEWPVASKVPSHPGKGSIVVKEADLIGRAAWLLAGHNKPETEVHREYACRSWAGTGVGCRNETGSVTPCTQVISVMVAKIGVVIGPINQPHSGTGSSRPRGIENKNESGL